MTTTGEAYDDLKAILATAPGLPPLRWPNEDEDTAGNVSLPGTPTPFLFTDFETTISELASFGGGLGRNRYRTTAYFDVYVFVPKGWGLRPALDIAESVAVLFRSYRDELVSCHTATARPGGDGANIRPPGLPSEVSNYFWSTAEVELWFDTIG